MYVSWRSIYCRHKIRGNGGQWERKYIAQHWMNPLQHTVTHCNTLQHTATHCGTLQTLQQTATHCNTLQHTATQKLTSRNIVGIVEAVFNIHGVPSAQRVCVGRGGQGAAFIRMTGIFVCMYGCIWGREVGGGGGRSSIVGHWSHSGRNCYDSPLPHLFFLEGRWLSHVSQWWLTFCVCF